MEESHSFVPLLIVVVLAFFVPLILTRLRIRLQMAEADIMNGPGCSRFRPSGPPLATQRRTIGAVARGDN